jgi:hypothetical protein
MMGTYHEMKGGAKAAFGSTFSGRVERAGGTMQATFGRVQKFFGW